MVRLTLSFLCAAAIAAFGCGRSTEPADEVVLTMQNLAGIYYGVTFTTEQGGVVTDQLRLGATIELILYSGGHSNGRLFAPADTSGCCGVDVNLVGGWDLEGNTVTLDLTNDSFLQTMALEFTKTQLTGQTTHNGVVYRVVLAW